MATLKLKDTVKAEKPLVLHAHTVGPNPFKVAILLEALGLPYTAKIWDFGEANNGVKGPVFTKINENGRLPALEDPNTGITSWESMACINYLLNMYDREFKFHAGPEDPAQQAVDQDKWTSLMITTLAPMQGQVNFFKYYAGGNDNEKAINRFETQAYRCYGILDAQLKKSGGKSILPSGVSATDFHYYPWISGHPFAGLTLDNYPTVATWLGNMKALPYVQAAYKNVQAGEKVQ